MTGSVDPDGFERLVAAMSARIARGELPGMVLLVARADDVRVQALGTRAFGGAEPMRRDTVFRIASLTKPILAAVTMMLVEDGTLALQGPVDRWLPELADRRVLRRIDGPLDDTEPALRPITLDDLLTFRMGFGQLMEPRFDPPFPIVETANGMRLVLGAPEPRTPHDPDTWIGLFGQLPLMYQPGQRWLYNAGSLVLGVLLARAAGQPLGELLARRLFGPLGMAETGFWLPEAVTGRLPSQYMTNPETGVMTEQTVTGPELWSRPPVFPSGAGGLLSTLDDYLAFARMMLHKGAYGGGRLLSERAVTAMTTNQLTPEQIAAAGPILGGSGWGYGMAVTVSDEDGIEAGQYGWSGGSGTNWFNDPNRGLIAIAMTQTTDFLFNGGLAEFRALASRC